MANRYTLTNEQRQQQVQALTEQLEEGVRGIFESENYANYIKVMSNFTHYSVRNTILIALQTDGNATRVAGYEAWQKKFGRQVNKGEKAIKIFAPMTYKKTKEVQVLDPVTKEPVLNPDGTEAKEKVEITIPSYRVVNVFDIAQTSGPPLPRLVYDLEGNVERYEDFVKAIRAISPVPIAFEEMDGKDGYYHQIEKRIAIKGYMSEAQTMAAMIHEVAHAKLHALDPERLKESAQERGKDTRTMEVEAESIAAVVSAYFGIDTSSNSWGYVASWSKNKELPELTASLQVIKDTAGEIIDGLVDEMEELRFWYMDKDEALEAVQYGELIYKANSRGEFAVVSDLEIRESDPDKMFRMPKNEMIEYMRLRDEVDLHENLNNLQEAKLLYVPENQFGIYQINEESKGRNYMFMSHDYIEGHELELSHEDYDLKYVAPLSDEETLDSIYERFNIERPDDFTGHSLSVSDIVVINRNQEIKAYFVDSFGFTEVQDFLNQVYEKETDIQEAAFKIENRYLEIHTSLDDGYDYSIYDESYRLLDGGLYESDIDLLSAAKYICQDLKEPVYNVESETYKYYEAQGDVRWGSRMIRVSYEDLEEKVRQAELEERRQLDEAKEHRTLIREQSQEYAMATGATITFYVAVCEEFHDMADYFDNLTIEEAAQKYREIRNDPTLGYYGNALGFNLHDEKISLDYDSAYPLVNGDTIMANNLDYVSVFKNHPMLLEAVELVKEQFPDYKYIASEVENHSIYPENMTVDEIADALIDFAKEYDFYEYNDQVDNEESLFEDVKYSLFAGEGMKNYGAYLSDIIDEKNMYSARAKVLLDRIKNLDPKLDHDMKPVVKFSKPSDYRFPTDKYISIQDADTLVRKTDQERFKPLIDGIAGSQLMHVDVTIVYSENQNVKVLQDTIFIGAGDGGIIDHLKRNVNDDMTIKNNKFEKLSPEEQQEYMENLEDVRDHVLPYLQEFISLEEETVHHVSDQSQAKSLNDSTAKKSIHDRLLENKEKISKIQGKDNLQKGVELA